jgi:hypothetical protein
MSRRALVCVAVIVACLSAGLTGIAWSDCVDTPITINFDAGSGMPQCYNESGMTVCALQVFGPDLMLPAALTLGDNDANTSPDLQNEQTMSGELVYFFDMGGAPFTLTSFDFVNFDDPSGNGRGYFVPITDDVNTCCGDFDQYDSGVVTPPDPLSWTNLRSFTWTVQGNATGAQVMDNLSLVATCCGNGVVDTGEQCDDGNTLGTIDDGNCCSATCQFEANGEPCTADDNFCTADFCDGTGMCTHPDFPNCNLTRPCGPLRPPGNVAFEHPRRSKSYQAEFVQAFVSCGNPGDNAPSTTTEGNIPSCSVETPNEEAGSPPNSWQWDEEKGRGLIKLISICKGAADAKVQFKMIGVVDETDAPANTTGTLAITVRVTLDDQTGGDMSTIPMTGAVPLSFLNGNGGVLTTLGVMLTEAGMTDIPNGSSIEVIDVQVKDPNGNVFARPGLYMP